jgi:hypothetical protein
VLSRSDNVQDFTNVHLKFKLGKIRYG